MFPKNLKLLKKFLKICQDQLKTMNTKERTVKNSLKIDNMKQLFLRYVSNCPMLTRNKCKYAVNRLLTERYRRSAIPDMQRKLTQSLM